MKISNYLSFFLFFSSLPLFSQTPPYAQLTWKNVEAGDGIGLRGLAIADLNLDGKNEIVATGWLGGADHFFIYDNQTGNYKIRWDSRLYPDFIKSLLVTKIDADNDPDIVVLSGYDSLEIYDGTTRLLMDGFKGQFGEVRSMAIGNIDSLPDKELVLIGSDSLRVFSLTTKKRKWAMGVQGGDVKIGDIDGDGRNEIFVAGLSWVRPGSSYVIDGYQKAIRWTITADTPFSKFDFYDVTGDGKLDLVASDGNAIYYFNTTTRRPITLANSIDGIESFYIGDADADGTPEILVGTYRSMMCFNFNGSIRWGMPNSNDDATNIAIGNIDSDASPEIVWGAGVNTSGSDHLVIGDFATQTIEHASLDYKGLHKVLLNDINFDQKLELVVTPLGTYGYDAPDAGDPTLHNESALIQIFDLSNHSLIRQTRYPASVNTLDAAVIGTPRNATVKDIGFSYNTYPTLFDNRLTRPVYESYTLSNIYSMAFLDVDGDGLDEWIWGKLNSLIAMKWTGTTFSQLWEVPVLGGAQIIKTQNIDADSAKEIIVVNNGAIKVFNSLTRVLKWETPNWSVTALDIVDMDNDKKVDLLIGTDHGEVIIFDIATQQIKKRSDVIDFTVRVLRGGNIDADTFGRAEIIVGDSKLRVIDGQTFATKWIVPEYYLSVYGYSVDFADIDGDKHVDLFIGNQNGVFQFRLRDTVFIRPFVTHTADLLPTKPQLIEKLYPNPTMDKLTINLNPQLNQPFIWRIYDINGRLIISESPPSVSKANLSIPVQNLSSGVYIFQIQTENAIENCRFVVANKM